MMTAIAFLQAIVPLIEALVGLGQVISPLITGTAHAAVHNAVTGTATTPEIQAQYDAALAEAQNLHDAVQAS